MGRATQLRRDTAAGWAATNPLLPQGQPGLVIDPVTGYITDIKFSDGITHWNNLPFWIPNSVKGASKLVSIGNCGYGSSYATTSSTSTVGTSRFLFKVGVDATNITVLFNHWYTGAGPLPDTYPAGPITFTASLELVSSSRPNAAIGTIFPLTVNGRTSITLDPGGSVVPDPLGIGVLKGDVVAVRTYLSSGTAWAPRQTLYGNISDWGGWVAASDLTPAGSGAITAVSGYHYGPSALLGNAAGSDNPKSVLLLGDSIGNGYTDSPTFTIPSYGPGGHFARALTGYAGYINLSINGDGCKNFQTTTGSFRRLANAKYCTSAINEYGTNDIVFPRTAVEIEGINLDIATTVRRLGIAKFFQTTLAPRTTSTDGWATVANQTALSTESERVAYNTWLRDGAPIDPTTLAAAAVGTSNALRAGSFGHPFTGVFDTAAKVESSLNSGKWLPANRIATGSMTSGNYSLTTSGGNLQTAIQELGGDTGTGITLLGAGAGGAVLGTDIAVVNSSTSATLYAPAGTTVTNAALAIGVTTKDGVHPAPHGYHLMAQAIDVSKL